MYINNAFSWSGSRFLKNCALIYRHLIDRANKLKNNANNIAVEKKMYFMLRQ